MPVSADSRIGTELAGYRIEALIGRGGMGVVYRAHDLALDRDVALKLLAPELADDVSFRERFLRESRLAASLEHPNVVPIHDAGEIDGQLYIAMRYVEGSDLKQLLARGAARAGAGRRDRSSRSRARSTPPTRAGSSTATSSPRTCCSTSASTSTWPTSASAGASATRRGRSARPSRWARRLRRPRADPRRGGRRPRRRLRARLPALRVPGRRAAVPARHRRGHALRPPGGGAARPARARGGAAEGARQGARRALRRPARELVEAARQALGIAEPKRSRWPLAVAARRRRPRSPPRSLAFFLTRSDGGGTASAPGGRLVRIDPVSNGVERSVAVGDGPEAVAAGSGHVWVASFLDGTLWQVDPRSGGPTRIAAVGRPFAVTIADGSAYVAASGPGQFTGNVSKFDAMTGDRGGGLQGVFCSLASGAYGVWVAGCPNVQKLSTEGATPRFVANVVIPFAKPGTAANQREGLAAMAQGEGAVWVIGDAADRRLWRIDPERHRIEATIDLGFPPGGVAAGSGAVWVTDELGDRVVRIDPATNRVVGVIPVGRGAMRGRHRSGQRVGRGRDRPCCDQDRSARRTASPRRSP